VDFPGMGLQLKHLSVHRRPHRQPFNLLQKPFLPQTLLRIAKYVLNASSAGRMSGFEIEHAGYFSPHPHWGLNE